MVKSFSTPCRPNTPFLLNNSYRRPHTFRLSPLCYSFVVFYRASLGRCSWCQVRHSVPSDRERGPVRVERPPRLARDAGDAAGGSPKREGQEWTLFPPLRSMLAVTRRESEGFKHAKRAIEETNKQNIGGTRTDIFMCARGRCGIRVVDSPTAFLTSPGGSDRIGHALAVGSAFDASLTNISAGRYIINPFGVPSYAFPNSHPI